MRRVAMLLCLLLPLAAAAEEPEEVYARFHRAIVEGNLGDMMRYAPAAQRTEMSRMSQAQKDAQVKMMAALMPRSYVLKDKFVNPAGQGARLLVSGMGPPMMSDKPETLYGTIRMVKEAGDWKVGDVSWSNTAPAAMQQAPAPKPAAATPAAKAAPQPATAKSAAAKSAAPVRTVPVVGSMDSGPERKLGTQKTPCVYKPVMTAEDLENCK